MRIIVTGATGLIGRLLCRRLIERGDQVVVFSRNPTTAQRRIPGAAEYIAWQPAETGPWAAAVDGADAIIHLAGAPIAGQRWDTAYKREIIDSRVLGTRGIVNAISQATTRPQVLVSASGIDYYGAHGDEKLDESTPPGDGFLSEVCVGWEREALRAETLGVRTCVMRIGLVLDKEEGALGKLLLPFRLCVGGPVLPGTQWWSWIHLDDLLGLLLLALDDERARGAINTTAPEPERNRDFAAALGKALGRPAIFPTPLFAVRLLVGEMAGPLLVEKQRVIPKKALELGYRFRYTQLLPALRATLAT